MNQLPEVIKVWVCPSCGNYHCFSQSEALNLAPDCLRMSCGRTHMLPYTYVLAE